MPHPRVAIYYTPPPDSPLSRFGSGALGYDCSEAPEVPRLCIPGVDPAILALATVTPRRYGIHATMVAPFRLRAGSEGDLKVAFSGFASRHLPSHASRATTLGYTLISLTSMAEKKRVGATGWTPSSVTTPTTRIGTI